MDPQITGALTLLGVTVITSLGVLVKLLTDRLRAELEDNTRLTTEAKEAANGNLRNALEHLAAERNRVLALRVVVREREDRLAYIIARLPEAEKILLGYAERRQRRATEYEESAALQKLTEDFEPEDAGE